MKSANGEPRNIPIYDPIRDEVKARNVSEIAYWTFAMARKTSLRNGEKG